MQDVGYANIAGTCKGITYMFDLKNELVGVPILVSETWVHSAVFRYLVMELTVSRKIYVPMGFDYDFDWCWYVKKVCRGNGIVYVVSYFG